MFRIAIPYPSTDTPLNEDNVTNVDPLPAKSEFQEAKKKSEQLTSTATNKKSKAKKAGNKPKLTSQNSINDEMEKLWGIVTEIQYIRLAPVDLSPQIKGVCTSSLTF